MVDSIEDRLLDESQEDDAAVLDSIFHLKHKLTALRMLAVPLREVVSVFLRPATKRIPEEIAAYFDDVRGCLIRVVDMIETMRDYLVDSLDIYTIQ